MARLQTSPAARVAAALMLIALVFLAAYGYQVRLQRDEETAEPAPAAPSSPIELDRFAARLEKTNEGERLTVGLRLRTSAAGPLDCHVFVVARTDRGTPHGWAIWPPDSPGMAISAGGHFHAAHPASGYSVSLNSGWQRVDAVLPLPEGRPPYDSVVVYVVGDSGNILLARPFSL